MKSQNLARDQKTLARALLSNAATELGATSVLVGCTGSIPIDPVREWTVPTIHSRLVGYDLGLMTKTRRAQQRRQHSDNFKPAPSVENDPKTVVMPILLARLSLMATRQKSFDRFAKSGLDARNHG